MPPKTDDKNDWVFIKILRRKEFKVDFSKNPKYFIDALLAEKEWHDLLLSEPEESLRLYNLFIDTNGGRANLRGVRVFFRIRQDLNYKKVYVNVKKRNALKLQKVPINATFCEWVFQNYQGSNSKKLHKIFERYKENRNNFVLNNSPMLLRIASIAKRNIAKNLAPEAASASFLAAIEAFDKYCPRYTKQAIPIFSNNILSCISSRIKASLGLMMSTRGVYLGHRGRKNLFKIPRMLKEGLTEEQVCKKLKINQEEMKRLVNSNDVEYQENLPPDSSDGHLTPEDKAINSEQIEKLVKVIGELDIIERKILVLKGLAQYEVLNTEINREGN